MDEIGEGLKLKGKGEAICEGSASKQFRLNNPMINVLYYMYRTKIYVFMGYFFFYFSD